MANFRRVFLHIGPHKTGSSAIQLMCDENRQLLIEHGIYYPQGRWHAQLGSYFSQNKAAYIYNKHAGNTDAAAIDSSDRAYITALRAELEKANCEYLLLSYEGFIDLQPSEIARFRDFLQSYGDDIRVLAYCRHTISFAPSEISQRCRMGVPLGRGDVHNSPIPKFKDYFSKFETVFGREQLNLSDFAIEALYKRDVRLDFLAKLGLSDSQATKLHLRNDRTNESLSAEAIVIGEAMAKRLPPGARGNLFFMRFNQLLDSIKGSPICLSRSEREEIMRAAQPHLDYLKASFGLTLHAPVEQEEDLARELFGDITIQSLANRCIENDAISQAYRWLLGREPESEEVAFRHLTATGGDWRRLRNHVMRSPEFGRVASNAVAALTKATAEATIRRPDTAASDDCISVADVTVCMIVFNEEEMLPRSLPALASTFSSFIIADMGSSDRTASIIKEVLGDSAKVVHYDRAKLLKDGYAAARSFCAQNAISEWVLMVDADEVLVAGADGGKIRMDRSPESVDLASIERKNLAPPNGLLPSGVRETERPRRLYRRGGRAFWTGYIHEELMIDAETGAAVANSSLLFEHLSAVRDANRMTNKRYMYRWMLLRAFENPRIRGGTNAWWFESFLPENIDAIRADAQKFQNNDGFGGRETSDQGSGLASFVSPQGVRREIVNKLWHGADPFAEAFCEPALVDMQGWNSDHPYFRELINAYRPCVIAEIGVWKGGSTIEIARQIKSNRIDAVVIAIDTWLGSWTIGFRTNGFKKSVSRAAIRVFIASFCQTCFTRGQRTSLSRCPWTPPTLFMCYSGMASNSILFTSMVRMITNRS